MSKEWLLSDEHGTYLLCDDIIDVGDHYVILFNNELEEPFPKTEEFRYPKIKSNFSYERFKVIWFYEKDKLITRVRCDEDAEKELTRALTEELMRNIDAEIIRRIREEFNNIRNENIQG